MPKWRVGRIGSPRDWDKLTAGFTRMREVTFVASLRDLLRPFDQGYESVELVLGHRLNVDPDSALRAGMLDEGKADARAIVRMKELMDSERLSVRVSKRTEHSKWYIMENERTIRVVSPSYNLTASHQGNTFMLLDFDKSDPGDPYDAALEVYDSIRSESVPSATIRELMELLRGTSGEETVRRINVWLTADPEPSKDDGEPNRATGDWAIITVEALEKLAAWMRDHPGESFDSAPKETWHLKLNLPDDPKERERTLKRVADLDPHEVLDGVYINPQRVVESIWVQSSSKTQIAVWPTAWVKGGDLLVGFRGRLIPRTASGIDRDAVGAGLGRIENYINTVDRAQTANQRVRERAKTMMYETLLYLFAAPFQHDYMIRRRAHYIIDREGPTLLVLTGQSGNGKTRFLEYCLKLMVGEMVGVLPAAATLSKAKARNARGRVLCFPLVFDEVTPKWLSSGDGAELVKSWWADWWEEKIPTPTIVFCGNDLEQKAWMGRRTKRVEFEVHFEKTDENEQLLDRLFAEPNDIYPFFARQYMEQVANGTVSMDALRAARTAMLSLYDIAGSQPPSYFPFEPVEETHDIGRERWLQEISHGKITMNVRGNPYLADFTPDMEKQVPEYLGYLRDVKHRRVGLKVVLEVPERFVEWIGRENLDAAMRAALPEPGEPAAAQPPHAPSGPTEPRGIRGLLRRLRHRAG